MPTRELDTCVRRYCRAVFTLAHLEQAIREAWSLDTADEDDGWTPENPSRGQCDITALVVHDLLGGEVLGADVYLDGERIERHMWNRLVSGIDVDLTRDQFRRGEVIGEPTVARRTPAIADPAHPRYHRYEAYLVLSDRVRARLGMVGWNRSGF
jgi:hypothetical protein